MILKKVHVQRFKSSWDSGVVEIEDDVTCLVGKNESGKTCFLEALYRLNPLPLGHRTGFDGLFDYPRRWKGRDQDTISESTPITAVFELEPGEMEAIENEFGEGVLGSNLVRVSKDYENTGHWDYEWDSGVCLRRLAEEHGLDIDLVGDTVSLAQLRVKLKAIDDAPPSVAKFLEETEGLALRKKLTQALASRLPKFLYFNQYSSLPGRVSIPHLQQADDTELEAGARTALSLLRLARVESEEFTEDHYEARKASLEIAANQISDELFEYWRQNEDSSGNSNLEVQFDVDPNAGTRDDGEPPFLEIRIRNHRHRMTLNFAERSTGFVWFFSFISQFSEFRDSDEQLILLLDEPGLGLHGSAQGDLLRYINERLAPQHQTIYSTHSPAMIDLKGGLHRCRTVEDVDKDGADVGGTRVSKDIFTTRPETVFPLLGAMGYELAQTLFVGPDNFVVEGPSDYLYLQTVSSYLQGQGRIGYDNSRWTIVPAGGLDKLPTFIALLGAELNVAVLLDVAAGGSQKINDLVKRGCIERKNLISLATVRGTKEADIEDLFDASFYLDLLRASGVADLKVTDLPPGPRIVKRIEKKLEHRYDHYAPARHLLENQVALVPKLSDATLDRFEQVFKLLAPLLS